MTRGTVAELYKLGVGSLAPALAGCYKVLCETVSLPQALKDGEVTRLRKTKGTGGTPWQSTCGSPTATADEDPAVKLGCVSIWSVLCAALVTPSRWQMRFSALFGSIDEANVLPAEHVRDSSPLSLA